MGLRFDELAALDGFGLRVSPECPGLPNRRFDERRFPLELGQHRLNAPDSPLTQSKYMLSYQFQRYINLLQIRVTEPDRVWDGDNHRVLNG
jgi:hypothetical protein